MIEREGEETLGTVKDGRLVYGLIQGVGHGIGGKGEEEVGGGVEVGEEGEGGGGVGEGHEEGGVEVGEEGEGGGGVGVGSLKLGETTRLN